MAQLNSLLVTGNSRFINKINGDITGDAHTLDGKTITDAYSGTSTDAMSGKAVKSAIDALDGTVSGSPSASKTLTAFSQTDGKVSATFGNISITKSQISDFPTIPTVNDATLTIQKNGTTIKTFTANASTNVTANIEVPDAQVNSDWSASSGVAQILNKPTLGTASAKDVPTSGNASTTQVVMGNDTRLTNSRTPTSHTHGNIQNTGALQTTDITIADGDKLVVTDSSDSSKIARTSIAFNGSTATKCLTQKGTWEPFTNNAGTITGITMNGASKGTSGVVDLGTVAVESEYGYNINTRLLARGNVFLPVWSENQEQIAGAPASYFYGGLVPMRLTQASISMLLSIPTGVTWSNFTYFRLMNMSVLSAYVTWTESVHNTSLIIGTIKDEHTSSTSNYSYTDYPLIPVVMSVLRDNGGGATRDVARLTINNTNGTIVVASAGSSSTTFANYHRVQFSVAYVNQQAYGPNDEQWYNENPSS